MNKNWEKLDDRVYDWDELEGKMKNEMAIILYGQGKKHKCKQITLAVGVLKRKWNRGCDQYNWTMGKHFLFSPDPRYDGYAPEYVISPPRKEYYCLMGFQSFTEFSYRELRKGLQILGYHDKAIKLAEYAVRCVFGDYC